MRALRYKSCPGLTADELLSGLVMEAEFVRYVENQVPAGLSDTACWPWAGVYFTGRSLRYGRVCFGGKSSTAHRVVWSVIHGVPYPDMEVCHKCDNPACCNPSHLFIGTAKDNAQDKILKGRGVSFKGSTNPMSKLQESHVKEILMSDESYSYLAKKYGVSWASIQLIKKRKTWRHVKGIE